MKNLYHKYIGFWLTPKYKRLAPKLKSIYIKFTDWRYGIKVETNIKNNDCCNGNCECKQGKDV